MAAPKKDKKKKKNTGSKHTVMSLQKRISALEKMEVSVLERLALVEEGIDRIVQGKTKSIPASENSIQKVESFNDEEIPLPETNGSKLAMTDADKLRSMENAIKILPPNYLDENGRHLTHNIGAICGFEVTPEMMDDVYMNVEHRGGFLVDKETGQRIQ